MVLTQARLLEGSPSVLQLFRSDPFAGTPPRAVRTVLWQYWFTDSATKERTGRWWERKQLGTFSGVVERGPDGQMVVRGAP